MDDCGARFEESEGLGGFFARLWNDEHYPYWVVSQDSTVGLIGLHSEGRTRGWGLHRGGIVRVCIRGFLGGNWGYHSNKLNFVVHGVDDCKERIQGGERKGKSRGRVNGRDRCLGGPLTPP